MTYQIHTISTTSTSASIRKLYKNVLRSFFICMELSSIWATVKILNLQFFQVRCCFSRKGINMRIPPSWTIHHISMCPATCNVHKNSYFQELSEIFESILRASWKFLESIYPCQSFLGLLWAFWEVFGCFSEAFWMFSGRTQNFFKSQRGRARNFSMFSE